MSEDNRPVTLVACGILYNREGKFLMNSRPQGKPFAGWWEFPGGKIELGEDTEAALRREIKEELGLSMQEATPWITLEDHLPHAYVRLHFARTWSCQGQVTPLEGQQLGLFDENTWPDPLLPAVIRIQCFMQLPKHWARINADAQTVLGLLAKLTERRIEAVMLEGDSVNEIEMLVPQIKAAGVKEVWVHVAAQNQAAADGVFIKTVEELGSVKHERLAVPALPQHWKEFEAAGALWAYSTGVQVGSAAWKSLFFANPMPIYLSGFVLDNDQPLRRHGAQGWIEHF